MAKEEIILDEHDHLNKHKDKMDKFIKIMEEREKEFQGDNE